MGMRFVSVLSRRVFPFSRLPRPLRILDQHPHTGQGNAERRDGVAARGRGRVGCAWDSHVLPGLCCPQLAAIKLARYGEDLLFYLYYMNGGDLLQLLAAVEL